MMEILSSIAFFESRIKGQDMHPPVYVSDKYIMFVCGKLSEN